MTHKHECIECGNEADEKHPEWPGDYCCDECLPGEIELKLERLQEEMDRLNERLH